MYTGSQWFAIPPHVVQWILEDPLPYNFSFYAQYIVVADENYFATLIMNSPYCQDIIRKNLLFVLFDKWENEINQEKSTRDERKCLSPNPDQCGRSPSILTMQFRRLLEISHASFARKFDPNNENSMLLIDYIDKWRNGSMMKSYGTVGDEGKQIMIRFSGMRRNDPINILAREQKQKTNNNTIIESNSSGNGMNSSDVNGSGINKMGGREGFKDSDEISLSNEEEDLCWEMSDFVGEPIRLNKCDASVSGQWFIIGNNSNIHYHIVFDYFD